MPATEPALPAAQWHGHPPETWQERWGLPDLRIFSRLGSTSDVARALAEAGAPSGTVVLADRQTMGRGRHGRGWSDAPGRSILFSMVLRPAAAGAVLPLRIGLAAATAIQDETGLTVGIKWPNDLVVEGRKLGGILCEGVAEGGRIQFVIAGVGINVLQTEEDWSPEIRGAATSVAMASAGVPSLPGLAGRIISAVSMAAEAGSPELLPGELERLEERDALRGREVTVDGRPAGRAAGLAPSGALLLERDGTLHPVINGTVRVRDEAEGKNDA